MTSSRLGRLERQFRQYTPAHSEESEWASDDDIHHRSYCAHNRGWTMFHVVLPSREQFIPVGDAYLRRQSLAIGLNTAFGPERILDLARKELEAASRERMEALRLYQEARALVAQAAPIVAQPRTPAEFIEAHGLFNEVECVGRLAREILGEHASVTESLRARPEEGGYQLVLEIRYPPAEGIREKLRSFMLRYVDETSQEAQQKITILRLPQ